MHQVRLAKKDRGKAWRAMIEVGPITLIDNKATYVVSAAHLDLLDSLGVSYKLMNGQSKNGKQHRGSPD